MALALKLVKDLENNKVQIDATMKNKKGEYTRHFVVDKDKADEFINDFKREMPKVQNKMAATMGIGSVAAAGLGLLASKKSNLILKTLSAFVFAGAGLVASGIAAGINSAKSIGKFMAKHNAEEVRLLKADSENVEKAEPEKLAPNEVKVL